MDDRTSVFVDAVQATRERMYRVARMMLRTDADAEDAVSTATMIAWKQLPRLRNLDALPAYLTRCTVNAARAMLRRRKRETLMDAAHLPERPAQSGKDTPVWMYLQRLPEKYRLPLALRYGEDLSLKDTAEILRIPCGTVSSRASRGLAMLRKELEKEDAEYDALLEQDNPFSQDCYGKLRKVLGSVAAYHLIDLDGDGKDECFFWDQNGNPQLYTMIDGKTAPVQTTGDKAFGIQGAVALCEGNVLKTYEEVGQAYQLYCFYTVDRGTLLEQNRLVYDIANDCWGLSLSGIHIDKALTKSEAEELLGSYVEIPLEHLPIESFPDDT